MMKFNVFQALYGNLLFFFLLVSIVNADNSVSSDFASSCSVISDEQIQTLKATKISNHQLNNGMRVFIYENHQLPVFALRLLFDVGASDEESGQSGYAHLFEHLMFKGSENVADGEHFAAIKRMGGHLNASTDYDRTDYWTEAPNFFLQQVLWLEAERLNNLRISEVSLENQRQAVLEEKLLRIDNVPYFKTASEFMISAWQGTDYDHLIIGTENDIKQASVDTVNAFFRRYYRPDNMILTLVGDVDTHMALEQINHVFNGKTRSGATTKDNQYKLKQRNHHHDRSTEPVVLSGRTEQHFDPLAPFPLYALGWHTVGKNNLDYYAVELLADILLNHDSSRLKYHLKEKNKLVFDTIGFPLTFEQAGITAMGMVPHSYAEFSEIKILVKNLLHELRLHGVSDEELCSAKKHRQLMILQKLSSNRKMAALIGDGVLYFNDPWHFITALESYGRVSHQDLNRVARLYFHDDWLALEITPGPGVRLLKWLMEILPDRVGYSLEHFFL